MKIEDRYKALGKLNSLYLHFTPKFRREVLLDKGNRSEYNSL